MNTLLTPLHHEPFRAYVLHRLLEVTLARWDLAGFDLSGPVVL